MKSVFVALAIINLVFMLYSLPASWPELQKDISIQAAHYQNSVDHKMIKQQQKNRNYNVGDTHVFWRWNLSVMPPTWIQTTATCRAVGEHCYIFVADSEWNNHMTQANVDTIMVRLEQNTPNNPNQGAISMDIDLFGEIPDELDNDPRLIVFYSALGSFNGISFDGYFSAYNQVTEMQAQQMNPPGHSNQCEMIYMTCYPLSPIAPIRMSVLAHELEHLIHWGQDPNEESWIDEGCAELAMVAYGIPDPITGFNSNPDNSLTVWNQSTADYVKVMLFFTYLKEHYDDSGLIRDLIADSSHGMNSFMQQVSLHYPQLTAGNILRNWSIANVLDYPEPDSGLYNYEELVLPAFSMTSVNQYPSLTNQTIQAYASDYLYYDLSWRPISFSIQVNNPVFLSELVFDNSGNCMYIVDRGIIEQTEFYPLPDSAHHVVFVITNNNPASVTYSYSASIVKTTKTYMVSLIQLP